MYTAETVAKPGLSLELSGETLVAVTDITKRYAGRVALQKLSLLVRTGEVFGLVGSNGSGKTTTLRVLAGILKPDIGHGQVLGFDLVNEAKSIRGRVGYMSQALSLYADLSVLENLRFRARVYGSNNPRAAAEIAIDSFELTQFARTPAGQLSGGWARRLQLAAALIHSPRLILLDEPTAGLDAVSQHDVWRRLERLAAGGTGVIISTHDLGEAERCSRAALLFDGKVVAAGLPEQIARGTSSMAFVLSGIDTRLLAQAVEAVPGVLASYPQGSNLRIVAEPGAEERLRQMARTNEASISRVMMRLEDAVLAFSTRRSSQ